MVQVTFNLAQLAAWPVSILETEIPSGHRYEPIAPFQALCAVQPDPQVPEWVLDAHGEPDSVRCHTRSAVPGPRVSCGWASAVLLALHFGWVAVSYGTGAGKPAGAPEWF